MENNSQSVAHALGLLAFRADEPQDRHLLARELPTAQGVFERHAAFVVKGKNSLNTAAGLSSAPSLYATAVILLLSPSSVSFLPYGRFSTRKVFA